MDEPEEPTEGKREPVRGSFWAVKTLTACQGSCARARSLNESDSSSVI